MIRDLFSTAAALLLALPAGVQAQSGPRLQLSATWPLLDRAAGGDCALAITGNGRFMQVAASGLIPGEAVRLVLVNGNMTPVRVTAYADGAGRFQRYYIPFRFNRDGGTVGVTVSAARCNLSAAAPWTRGSITVH